MVVETETIHLYIHKHSPDCKYYSIVYKLLITLNIGNQTEKIYPTAGI